MRSRGLDADRHAQPAGLPRRLAEDDRHVRLRPSGHAVAPAAPQDDAGAAEHVGQVHLAVAVAVEPGEHGVGADGVAEHAVHHHDQVAHVEPSVEVEVAGGPRADLRLDHHQGRDLALGHHPAQRVGAEQLADRHVAHGRQHRIGVGHHRHRQHRLDAARADVAAQPADRRALLGEHHEVGALRRALPRHVHARGAAHRFQVRDRGARAAGCGRCPAGRPAACPTARS